MMGHRVKSQGMWLFYYKELYSFSKPFTAMTLSDFPNNSPKRGWVCVSLVRCEKNNL